MVNTVLYLLHVYSLKLIHFVIYQEPWSEAHQERLELLRARVLELNRQLGALAAGWRHGQLSLHMNLALPAMALTAPSAVPNNASVLRSQNRILAEVCDLLVFTFFMGKFSGKQADIRIV